MNATPFWRVGRAWEWEAGWKREESIPESPTYQLRDLHKAVTGSYEIILEACSAGAEHRC
jgi:hypothetical protein